MIFDFQHGEGNNLPLRIDALNRELADGPDQLGKIHSLKLRDANSSAIVIFANSVISD